MNTRIIGDILGTSYFLICLICPCIIAIIVSIRQIRRNKKAAALAQSAKEYRDECIRNAQKERQALFEHYLISGKEILAELCDNELSVLPYEIAIFDDRVEAQFDHAQRTYSFCSHRIEEFKYVSFTGYSYKDANCASESNYDYNMQTAILPQHILAQALNRLLGNQYNCKDNAEITSSKVGEDYFNTYSSRYVILRLKATRSL